MNTSELAARAGFSSFHRYQLRKMLESFASLVAIEQAETDACMCEDLGKKGCGSLYIAASIRNKVKESLDES